jgi:tetratricopeptide (TPR) repeat protein
VLLVSLALPSMVRANPAWHPIDADELARVRGETPPAAALFDTAEEKLRLGDLKGAEAALAEARTLVTNSWLLGRRHCQVLTELGRRVEAREACQQALIRSSAMDSRAMVGALMASKEPATPADLIQAVRESVAARRLREQPFSDAALCEIAHHIGDEAMLNSCVESLQRIAPHHFETLRWQSVQKQAPAWALWLGWLLLAFAAGGTGLHALWGWLRRPAKSRPAVAASLICLAAVAFAPAASAQAEAPAAAGGSPKRWQLSRFPINHDNPESAIPSITERNNDPLEFGYFLQDLNTEALKAEREGDYRTSVKYWRAAATAVPDAAVSFGKACRAYQKLGEREQAIEFCSKALNLQGATEEDYLRFGELVTQKSMPLSELEVKDLDAVVAHLRAEKQEGGAAVVECRLGVKQEDAARLQRCTQVLSKLSPNDPRSMAFMWSYAILRKDYGAAKRLVAAMEKAGMPKVALAEVKAATDKASAWWRRPFTDWRYAVGAVAALIFAGLGLALLRRRLARVEGAPSAGTAPAT